ncbi:MAG: hypothetical protein NTU99_14685, partial [Pseudanabaena sp. LacPavin_0818_WC45_MAG_42_6]|nr:hypothetical protein [Pseudanabaena sp. LacPavin_0818_WC45_MAG_42_6]
LRAGLNTDLNVIKSSRFKLNNFFYTGCSNKYSVLSTLNAVSTVQGKLLPASSVSMIVDPSIDCCFVSYSTTSSEKPSCIRLLALLSIMTANVTVYRKVSLCEILLSAILIMKTIWGCPATAALENPKLFF